MLYPIKFKPLHKETLWGGVKLRRDLGKKFPEAQLIGESWEISGVEGDVSVVSNGFLKGNNLQEIIEIYMGEMVGDSVFRKYADEFPVLLKLIDAADDLSIQVHPNDALAAERHNAWGKTEMWYVIDTEPHAALYIGFNRKVSREEYAAAVDNGTLPSLLNRIEVKRGQAFFIPAGTIHAIGRGCLLAEIQQTSDITYRVYDWDREDEEGNHRELHTELALGAIDFGVPGEYNVTRSPQKNTAVRLADSPYFLTNLIGVEGAMKRDYSMLDSFVAYMCVEGALEVKGGGADTEKLKHGESMLIPADIDSVELTGNGLLLEVYMDL